MLVHLGGQLRAEGDRADAAEERADELADGAGPNREAEAEALRAALGEQRIQLGAAEREAAEQRARRADGERAYAELRDAHEAAQEELSALSPEFFDEIESLKYAHSQGAAQLARYERLYGRLPPEQTD
ncbi:hypothetical protein T492DRAFT_843069 [Pavlovales sp. CCMP2436]|nr:hypothetical protein T492DRAFT_843069 [Pavlovales sp. CCMP2436]|mmetsp:Transcript_22100/g.52400  ORF Transcript_22100/g.52400 Transcript_22100/m.52400 type:complete len:129 (+) Transcript_22100:857-1243(+)